MITLDELNRLKELEAKTTQGSWEYTNGEIIAFMEKFGEVAVLFQLDYGEKEDAQFITESRNLLPKLIESFEVMMSALQEIYEEDQHITNIKGIYVSGEYGTKAQQALREVGALATESESESGEGVK